MAVKDYGYNLRRKKGIIVVLWLHECRWPHLGPDKGISKTGGGKVRQLHCEAKFVSLL